MDYSFAAQLVGLIMQVGGIAVAGVALALEWRADARLEPSRLSPPGPRPVNPYSRKTGVTMKKTNSLDRRAYDRRVRGEGLVPNSYVGTDPEVVNALEWLLGQQAKREQFLSEDWTAQRAQMEETRDELRRLFSEQSRLLIEQQRDSRHRVLAESLGLLLAVAGTIVSGVAGLS